MTLVLEAIGRALPKLGVTFMAGLPDSGNYELVHAARAAGVSYLGTNHEAGAVGAADGWTRVMGRPALAMLSQGPGLTNGLTALTEAVKSRTSMVVIAIDAPRSSRHGNLNVDQVGVCQTLGAGVEVVRSAASAVSDSARALHRAVVEGRPVVLMVPLDLIHAEVPEEGEAGSPVAVPSLPWPAPDAVAAAADMLAGSSRPVVLAGRGAFGPGARDALTALAERSGALLATSAPAKGLFAGDPFDLGIAGSFASPLAAELLPQADLVLAFGASVNAWTSGNGRMIRQTVPVIQVDADPRALGVHRPATLPITGDSAITAQQLVMELERRGWRKEGFRSEDVAKSIRVHKPASEFEPVEDASGLDPRAFTVALNAVLPHERTVTVDSGHFMGWPAKYLDAPDAAGFLYPQSFQCVGLGLGVSIGAAIARPDRVSVLAIGDGGMMLSPQELETATRHRLPLLVVVYHDGAYGAEVHRFAPMGLEVDLVQFSGRDFAAMARAVGAQGLEVRSLDDLDALTPWLSAPDGPMVLDVHINPNVLGDWVAGNSKAALA
jgi:thiamine pyrophosphate-dependent acetolactate synthase large subunit-like protein